MVFERGLAYVLIGHLFAHRSSAGKIIAEAPVDALRSAVQNGRSALALTV
jgi:hypothetical protein